MSYVFVGIYWNNHHHLLQATQHINGSILWANLHLLFWLSLVRFVTGRMSESHFDAWPAALYGVVLLFSGIAYFILAHCVITRHGKDSLLATSLGRDFKGKVSVAIYALAIPLAFVRCWIACARWRPCGSFPIAGSRPLVDWKAASRALGRAWP